MRKNLNIIRFEWNSKHKFINSKDIDSFFNANPKHFLPEYYNFPDIKNLNIGDICIFSDDWKEFNNFMVCKINPAYWYDTVSIDNNDNNKVSYNFRIEMSFIPQMYNLSSIIRK